MTAPPVVLLGCVVADGDCTAVGVDDDDNEDETALADVSGTTFVDREATSATVVLTVDRVDTS